jgi:hypothetical protein
LAVQEGTNSLVVGLTEGQVYYYKNDILKFKNEKPRLLHESPNVITGLAFKVLNKAVLVYVATDYSIITIILGGKDKDEKVFSVFLFTVMVPKFLLSISNYKITWVPSIFKYVLIFICILTKEATINR